MRQRIGQGLASIESPGQCGDGFGRIVMQIMACLRQIHLLAIAQQLTARLQPAIGERVGWEMKRQWLDPDWGFSETLFSA